MKFHLITSSLQDQTVHDLLKKACEMQAIDFVLHDVENMDMFELPVLGADDLLYRQTVSRKAVEAQRKMITAECSTFNTDWRYSFSSRAPSYFIHEKYGFPTIPSFSGIPNSEEELQMCIEQLGPFPLIIKVLGSSLGVGVMKVDSIESMRSVLDYLKSIRVNVLVRKYIDHEYYVRAVVVGDKVVASHAAFTISQEFRTNAGDDTHQKREARVLSPELQALIVESVRVMGMETGGVDLLFDKDGKPYIAEVNFPNNFSTTQRITGVDIASEMVAYLVNKAKINSAKSVR
jgi:RimK family alpha-L-glutamate ligase